MKRCEWVPLDNELYVKYHDEEWGVAVHDDKKLFEFLILEGAQAGLSWSTVLKKRKNYRKAFDGFDFEKVALYDESAARGIPSELGTSDEVPSSSGKIDELMGNEGIIRNRLKINSAIRNAKVFIEIRKEFGSFDDYIWGFALRRGIGRQVSGVRMEDWKAPVTSELSDEISVDLKKRGMNFVGSTIIYAFMQAVGIVNDHEANCFCNSR